MKLIFFLFISPFIFCCISTQNTSAHNKTNVDYANSITAHDLKEHLYIYAGDAMEGRMTGTKGQKMAAEYLRDFYIDEGIESPIEKNNYYQNIPASYFEGKKDPKATENVLAFIK